jgi:hypothetical protein
MSNRLEHAATEKRSQRGRASFDDRYGTTKMNDADNSALLMATVLHDLVTDAEALLLIANALEDRACDVSSNADPQKLRETAALVKSAALQIGLAAANMVGSAERLRLVAELREFTDKGGGELPS